MARWTLFQEAGISGGAPADLIILGQKSGNPSVIYFTDQPVTGDVTEIEDKGATGAGISVLNTQIATDGTTWGVIAGAISNENLYTSTNPDTTWTLNSDASISGSPIIRSIATDGTNWFAARGNSEILTSANPAGVWSLVSGIPSGMGGITGGICHDGSNQWLAAGNLGNDPDPALEMRTIVSQDGGVTWVQPQTDIGSSAPAFTVCNTLGEWVIYGPGTRRFNYKDTTDLLDTTTWTQVSVNNETILDMMYDNGIWMLTTTVSTGGISTSKIYTMTSISDTPVLQFQTTAGGAETQDNIQGLEYDGVRWIAVGFKNTSATFTAQIYTSTDNGVTWTQNTVGTLPGEIYTQIRSTRSLPR